MIIKKNKKTKLFKNWSFMNQSKNFVEYLEKNNLNFLSTGKDSLKDIELIEKIFNK